MNAARIITKMAATTLAHVSSSSHRCVRPFGNRDAIISGLCVERNTQIASDTQTMMMTRLKRNAVRTATATSVQQREQQQQTNKKSTLHNLFICIYFFWVICAVWLSSCIHFACAQNRALFARCFIEQKTWISSLYERRVGVQWYLFAHSKSLANNQATNRQQQ